MRGNVRWGKVLGRFVGVVGNCLSSTLHVDEIVIQMKLNEKRLTEFFCRFSVHGEI